MGNRNELDEELRRRAVVLQVLLDAFGENLTLRRRNIDNEVASSNAGRNSDNLMNSMNHSNSSIASASSSTTNSTTGKRKRSDLIPLAPPTPTVAAFVMQLQLLDSSALEYPLEYVIRRGSDPQSASVATFDPDLNVVISADFRLKRDIEHLLSNTWSAAYPVIRI